MVCSVAGLVHAGLEVAHVAGDLHRLGLQMHRDLGMALHARDQLGQEARHVRAFEGVVDLAQLTAEHGFLFAQVHGEALVGERQRRGHAGQAAAQHERRLNDRQFAGAQRLEVARARHGHAHEVGGLFGGGRRDRC